MSASIRCFSAPVSLTGSPGTDPKSAVAHFGSLPIGLDQLKPTDAPAPTSAPYSPLLAGPPLLAEPPLVEIVLPLALPLTATGAPLSPPPTLIVVSSSTASTPPPLHSFRASSVSRQPFPPRGSV